MKKLILANALTKVKVGGTTQVCAELIDAGGKGTRGSPTGIYYICSQGGVVTCLSKSVRLPALPTLQALGNGQPCVCTVHVYLLNEKLYPFKGQSAIF